MESPLPLLFKWKFAGFAISLVIGMAGILMRTNHYVLAEICLGIAGVWALITWRFSEFLQRGANELSRLKKKADKANAKPGASDSYIRTRRYYYYWERSVSIVIGLLTICALLWVRTEENKYELSLWEGRLYPDNEPIPSIHCPLVDDDTLLLFLGSNGIAFTKVFPRPVIRVRGVDILTIDKNDDGSLAVSAIIKREDGKILAEIKGGEFILAQGHIFKKERPSLSQLRVTDEFGDVVLDLKFFNPRAMWIIFKSYGFVFQGSKLQNNQTCLGGHGRKNIPMIDMFPPPPGKIKEVPEAPKSDP